MILLWNVFHFSGSYFSIEVLIFLFPIYCNLQHYEGDISELELYFVIVNNEYGEQTEEELIQGGKNIRVTNENVITFIHLVSNHRLNFQVVWPFILVLLVCLTTSHHTF